MIRQTIFPFKIERTEETLTAHGGLALMAEYNHGLGLRALVDRHLPAPGSNRGYAPSVYVDTLILMLQAGGRHLEDLRELHREAALMKLIDREEIPDPDSAGDWLRRMGDPLRSAAGLMGLAEVRDLLNQRILRRDGKCEYTLDMDAMLVEAEKREAQMSYKGLPGYMPMLGFLFEAGICLHDEFREGNVSPGSGQLAFYRACKARMPEGKRIRYGRADSAAYVAELINEWEADAVFWAVTADQDSAVKALIRGIKEEQWQEPVAGCGYQIAEAVHSMQKTDRAFRLIIKRWEKPQRDLFEGSEEKYGYHVVASNWPVERKSAHDVLIWHNQRGSAENFDLKGMVGGGTETTTRPSRGDLGWSRCRVGHLGPTRSSSELASLHTTCSLALSGCRCLRHGSGIRLRPFGGS